MVMPAFTMRARGYPLVKAGLSGPGNAGGHEGCGHAGLDQRPDGVGKTATALLHRRLRGRSIYWN